MAGDWIKVETCTPDKPEVWEMAQILGIDPDAVVGKLFRVWVWFDEQTQDGNAPSVTKNVTSALLERLVGVSGFCEAMVKVGWMSEENGVVAIPNFDRHNGESAKKRALTARRVANHKAKAGNAKGNAASVTSALPREEKRRDIEEEKTKAKKKTETTKSSNSTADGSLRPVCHFVPPSVDQVRAYCRERANSIDAELFVDHYKSNGWKRGKSSIVDWKAAVRTWEKRDAENQRNGGGKESSVERRRRVNAELEARARRHFQEVG